MMMMMMTTMIIIDIININNNKLSDFYRTSPLFLAILWCLDTFLASLVTIGCHGYEIWHKKGTKLILKIFLCKKTPPFQHGSFVNFRLSQGVKCVDWLV